jgi:hypothetical protein
VLRDIGEQGNVIGIILIAGRSVEKLLVHGAVRSQQHDTTQVDTFDGACDRPR